MEITRLGWAGIELEHDGATIVVDPITGLGSLARIAPNAGPYPAPRPGAVAALVTHLHRDHTDAGALAGALAPGAQVLRPERGRGGRLETGGLDEAEGELTEAGLVTEVLAPWDARQVGPFTVTALPAVDGFGDPQVSWAVEAGDTRVVHLGDTLFHGHWWLIRERCGPFDAAFLPINGAVCDFPHRQPPSPYGADMDPDQAAAAAAILQPTVAVPMHYDDIHAPPHYAQVDDPLERFTAACAERGVATRALTPSETL